MNVKKRSVVIDRIVVDLVLCPKTGLYLQNLYCRRCGSFKLDSENHIDCTYKKIISSEEDRAKDTLIKEFSKEFGNYINEVNNSIFDFSQRLKNSKTVKNVKSDNERDEDELSKFLKKKNLSIRLEHVKKEGNQLE